MTKRIALLLAALIFIGGAGCALARDDAASKYKEALAAVQEALKLKLVAEKTTLEAVHKYEMALSTLREIKTLFPDWRADELSRTTEECQRAIAELKGISAVKAGAADADTTSAILPAPKEPAQPPPSAGAFIGSRGTKKMHLSSCQYGQKISARNRVLFKSYEEAAAAGYIPCKICKPDQAAASRPPAETGSTPGMISGSTEDAPPAPAAVSSGDTYVASAAGRTFHRPGCEWTQRITPQNLVLYKSRDEAIAAGKKPCQVCNP